jgi:ADP-heptose:LPS heptosyltransferase
VLRADGRFSIVGSAELIRRAAVFVTGDTGPMHIAAAVGAPIVAMLGPTMPIKTGPYAADAVVLRKQLHCSPCLAKKCPLNVDPPPCMGEITVDEVYRATLARLAERGEQRRSA